MTRKKVLVNLMGEQPLPNAMPVLSFNPDIVEMILSGRTRSVGESLSAWLTRRGISAHFHSFTGDSDAFDLNAVSIKLTDIIKEHQGNEIIVNLTGGTKIMSLAAAAICSRHNLKSYYIDTQNQRLWQVQPAPDSQTLKVPLTVEDIFLLHGQSTWEPGKLPSQEICDLAWYIAKNYASLNSILKNLSMQRMDLSKLKSRKDGFLGLCVKAGVLTQTLSGAIDWGINRRFFTGNEWLECLVYQACKTSNVFDDIQWRVKVEGGDTTDIDVTAAANGTLYSFSCKAGWFKNEHVDQFYAQSERVGGKFSKKILVTVKGDRRHPQTGVSISKSALLSRAAQFDLKVFFPTDFSNLQDKIKRLVRTR